MTAALHVTAQLDETSIIDAVARRYAVVIAESCGLVQAYRLLWRTYNGSTYGLRWSAMQRVKMRRTTRVAVGTNRWLTNDLADLGMAAYAVALFTQRAINLYEVGRKPHVVEPPLPIDYVPGCSGPNKTLREV